MLQDCEGDGILFAILVLKRHGVGVDGSGCLALIVTGTGAVDEEVFQWC